MTAHLSLVPVPTGAPVHHHPAGGLSEEIAYDIAHETASHELPTLVAWLEHSDRAAGCVDDVLVQLGVPEPDRDPTGAAVPGSILRKVLHYAQAEMIASHLVVPSTH